MNVYDSSQGDFGTIEFDHTPHFNTLCDKKSHFSRVSDALAEFIDNSIQACRGKLDRKIQVDCFLSSSSSCNSRSYLVISDNGKWLCWSYSGVCS